MIIYANSQSGKIDINDNEVLASQPELPVCAICNKPRDYFVEFCPECLAQVGNDPDFAVNPGPVDERYLRDQFMWNFGIREILGKGDFQALINGYCPPLDCPLPMDHGLCMEEILGEKILVFQNYPDTDASNKEKLEKLKKLAEWCGVYGVKFTYVSYDEEMSFYSASSPCDVYIFAYEGRLC